jgi:dethiobiotin synthetase
VEAIERRGLTLAGWVANQVDSHLVALEENFTALTARIAAPCLGLVPLLAHPDNSPITDSIIRFPV